MHVHIISVYDTLFDAMCAQYCFLRKYEGFEITSKLFCICNISNKYVSIVAAQANRSESKRKQVSN